MQAFIGVYLDPFRSKPLRILDVGSCIVLPDHPTYRTLLDCPTWEYVGLDVNDGLNVDVVVAEPYRWDEIAADSVDVVISGQALEHIELFWVTAFEIGRVMRPGAITMLIAPSSGFEHRFPVDCWRFYRDGMRSIADYLDFEVLEAYTEWGRPDWADSILVMRKPLWGEQERLVFDRRRAWQQAAASGREPVVEAAAPFAEPSILSGVEGGRLEFVLEDIRRTAMSMTPAPDPIPVGPAVPPGPRWRRIARRVLGRRGVSLVRRIRARRQVGA